MMMVYEKVKRVLTDYGNMNFEKNMESLLTETNKTRKEFEFGELKPLLESFNLYRKRKTEETLYACKDEVILLYNKLNEQLESLGNFN